MTIPQLIESTTRRIQKEFYACREHYFWRDYRALVKAISKYGYECEQRGWEIKPLAIYWDISRLLDSVRARRADIEYLPAYLEATVRSHVSMRAEEIQARSQNTGRTVRLLVDGLQPVAQVVSSDTELLAALHLSLFRRKSRAKPHKQLQLL